MDAETGAQLLARLGSKPLLEKIDESLFVKNSFPKPGDLVEFYGPSGTGKSEMLLNYIVKCILPDQWQDFVLGGIGIGVIFLDTEHQFSMLRLYSLLEAYIMDVIQQSQLMRSQTLESGSNGSKNSPLESEKSFTDKNDEKKSEKKDSSETHQKQTSSDVESIKTEEIIKSCLKNLLVLHCKSSQQLAVTLHSLEAVFTRRSNFGVLMIDTSSAFYWSDKTDAGDNNSLRELNQQKAAMALQKLLKDYNIVCFTTKYALLRNTKKSDGGRYATAASPRYSPHNFSSSKVVNPHKEFMCSDWKKLVTQRFIFRRENSWTEQTCSSLYFVKRVLPIDETDECKFVVNDKGIRYVK